MTVIYATSLKSIRMQAVLAAIDGGTGPGYLEICSAGYVDVLSTITLAKPSFSESNGVLTMLGTPRIDTSADHDGDAAIARIKDSEGNIWASGLTVGTSNADIILNAVEINAGQQVTLASGTITHG